MIHRFALASILGSFLSVVAEQTLAAVNYGSSGLLVAEYSTQGNSDAERNCAERNILLRITIHCFSFPPPNFVR